jgi:hypothetical protein
MFKDYGCAGCSLSVVQIYFFPSFLPSGPSSADQLPVAIVLNCERRKGSPSTMIPSTFRLCLPAFLAFLCATQAASKSTGEHHNEHPRPPPTKHCTVQHNHNGADDSANILKAFKDCATDSVITFLPANYSAFTPITLAGLSTFSLPPLTQTLTRVDNVVIHLNGNLLLPNNITKIQQEMNVTTNPPNVSLFVLAVS